MEHLPMKYFTRHVVSSIILLIILANLPAQIHARRQTHPRGSHTRVSRQLNSIAPECTSGPCHPGYGNLLIGRQRLLKASSTCGLTVPVRYCLVSRDSESSCEECDSRTDNSKSHTVDKISTLASKDTWWQAENGKENVTIEFNLDAEFHITYIIVRFRTFLPAVMYIERSYDFGKTWQVYQYFAHDCALEFPGISQSLPKSLNEAICTEKHSKMTPTRDGKILLADLEQGVHMELNKLINNCQKTSLDDIKEVTWYPSGSKDKNTCGLKVPGNSSTVSRHKKEWTQSFPRQSQVQNTKEFSVTHLATLATFIPGIEIQNIILAPLNTYKHLLSNKTGYSNEILTLVKATNIRLNLVKLHTLGHDKLDSSRETAEKYFFAINGMNIRGMCSCYGHSSECIPAPGEEEIPEMVYGVCNCSHNTQGKNCEKCLDNYNDAPWKPASENTTNACKKCECNEHATTCHFDEAVYIESGNRSGGVCDGCQHNTRGINCEQCLPFFYRDPSKDLADPAVCKQCDCEPGGSVDNGECDSHTDNYHGLQAGRCHCKQNVRGDRCDTCKHGNWNFNESNPYGCDDCNCNPEGTRDGSCDPETGSCNCKRFVEGKQCNQCMKGFWGLSANSENGCQRCNCGVEAVDDMCDTFTGQCKCFSHMTGRTCNQTTQGYFIPMPHTTVNAEEAEFSEGCTVITKQLDSSEEREWTLTKSVRCPTSNSDIVFPVKHIHRSTTYDIVIRYSTSLESSSTATIVVRGEGSTDDRSPCPQQWNTEEDAVISLDNKLNSASVHKVCLDRGKSYKIRISFRELSRYGSTSTATALINIDSIVLVPQIPSRITERYGELAHTCTELLKQNTDGVNPEGCEEIYKGFGVIIFAGAQACRCNVTGSTSLICAFLGGQCKCKNNVVGRRCDQCEDQHYAFSPTGCQACDCDDRGSLGGQCDVNTGQCKCRPGVYGAKCDRCQPGFYNFPNCKRCECNGHATECDSITGSCLYCQNNTSGQFCDKCVDGFYGDPRLSVQIACRPCPCPGTAESGHYFANKCALGPGNDVICECAAGYTGNRCDKCAENFYGTPEVPGGKCKVCGCNGNIDMSKPGSCDSRTGECHNCMFNSEGPQCEFCKDGYYKDEKSFCAECVCDYLGTIQGKHCNKTSGQCECLPNVVGVKCDTCRENHWKLASGKGCEPCNCNPDGAIHEKCNEFSGQCECKKGLGGRKCDQCPRNHWGNPKINCHKCECDAAGSVANQCNRDDGSCNCLAGISGYNCNECARGYSGNVPYCQPCGECFENWDLTLAKLRDETFYLIHNVSELKETGISGAYSHDFKTLTERVNDVYQMLQREVTPEQLDELRKSVDRIREDINIVAAEQLAVEQISRNVSERILFSKLSIDDLERKLISLRSSLNTLRRNATRLQESNLHGALNLIKDASQRSVNAQNEAKSYQKKSHEAEKQCLRAEAMLDTETAGMEFTTKQDENTRTLTEAQRKLDRLQDRLPDINDLVCSDRGNPCSELCGGGGCDTCGGLSCDGAVDKAKHALKYAQEADRLIREKAEKGDHLLREINNVMEDSEKSYVMAQDAMRNVSKIGEAYHKTLAEHAELANRANAFLKKSQPAALIRTKIAELQVKTIPFESDEILELARVINVTIRSLTDIDSILEESHDDKQTANRLRYEAETTKEAAQKMANTSQIVVNALKKAQEAQETAEIVIQNATNDADTVSRILPQIAKLTNDAHTRTNETLEEVKQLEASQKHLQSRFLKTSGDVQEMMVEATLVERDSRIAIEGANKLRIEHGEVFKRIEQEADLSNETRIEADRLLERAANFSFHVNSQLRQLQDMEISYEEYGKTAASLSDEIEKLTKTVNQYLSDIIEKSRYYHGCMS